MPTYIAHLVNRDRTTRICDGKTWEPVPERKGTMVKPCEACIKVALKPPSK